jgi:hypothetical protein
MKILSYLGNEEHEENKSSYSNEGYSSGAWCFVFGTKYYGGADARKTFWDRIPEFGIADYGKMVGAGSIA